mgnify:CR=1 FL=1
MTAFNITGGFVGVGMVALPMDLLRDYAKRPEPLDLQDYAKQRMMLNERAQQLAEVGAKLGFDAHRKRDRKSVKKFNQFKQAVYFLERDWNRVKTAYKERGGGFREEHGEWCRQAIPLSVYEEKMEEVNATLVSKKHTPMVKEELVGGRLYTGPLFVK